MARPDRRRSCSPRCTSRRAGSARRCPPCEEAHRRPGRVPDPARRGPAADGPTPSSRTATWSTWCMLRDGTLDGGRVPTRHRAEEAVMRVAIAGAGNVGRSIAAELLENGHEVLLIDKDPRAIKAESVPRAEWLLADACELASLEEAGLQRCQVVDRRAPATTRSTWSSRCWPRPSSACPGWSPGSTTRRTSGCSTRRGASTSRSPRRGSCRRWSRRRSRSATWSGCSRSARARPTWSS